MAKKFIQEAHGLHYSKLFPQEKIKFKFIKTELNHHAKIMSLPQFCNTEILT